MFENKLCFFILCLLQAIGVLLIDICCKHNKGFCFVEYYKKCNFGQKTQCENGKKRKHRKKTIQVSNFHNAAETDVNLTGRKTGRKQTLIQKSRCCFLTEKRRIIFGNNFKPYKVRFNFSKKRKRFFFWKRSWTKREILPFRFPKTERFLFYVQPNGKNRLILFTEKLSGRKTAFIQKASNRLTREQNFLIIDWHCYIIITIVTKK